MSPEIIFITLSIANKLRVVCDVVEHEFSKGNKVVINVSDETEGKNIDNMLWSWKQSSFIPHSFSDSLIKNNQDPVLISTNVKENISYETLILIHPADLDICNYYKKVIDFAEKYNPTKLETDRKRYKLYREKKYNVKTLNPGEYLHK